jgi:outer membrane protein OmpA-like peptidoglycan-associated protein/outer membrane protein W
MINILIAHPPQSNWSNSSGYALSNLSFSANLTLSHPLFLVGMEIAISISGKTRESKLMERQRLLYEPLNTIADGHVRGNNMKVFLLALVMLTAGIQPGRAQNVASQTPGQFSRIGRWSIGLRAGANMWVNDLTTRKISGAGDLSLRYALSHQFSLGILAGYEVLQSENTDNVQTGAIAPPVGYVEDKGVSADLVAWYYFTAGRDMSPYVYLGVGGYLYKRKAGGDVYWPENKNYISIHIPVGLGLDLALSRQAVISVDVGVRILDDYTDYSTGAVGSGKSLAQTDWYPTARFGVSFYLGGGDDDDNDNDGLSNREEKIYHTNPNNADTDGDGLSDGEEVNRYKTDPRKVDSDGDGLTDGDEVRIYGTNPNLVDTDADGLSDGSEVLQYHTNPLKADTDDDGLTDGEEVLRYKTNPLKPDTDGDGLTDGQEVNQYKTDPLKADTDGGSVYDGQEVANKTNPLIASDDVSTPSIQRIIVGRAIVLGGIVFTEEKATIEPQSEQTLIEAFIALKTNPDITAEIRGYTDNTGKASANKTLSQRRAESVRAWLIQNGIESNRLTAKGFGPEYPIGDNRTAEGRSKNQRIELFRTK